MIYSTNRWNDFFLRWNEQVFRWRNEICRHNKNDADHPSIHPKGLFYEKRNVIKKVAISKKNIWISLNKKDAFFTSFCNFRLNICNVIFSIPKKMHEMKESLACIEFWRLYASAKYFRSWVVTSEPLDVDIYFFFTQVWLVLFLNRNWQQKRSSVAKSDRIL